MPNIIAATVSERVRLAATIFNTASPAGTVIVCILISTDDQKIIDFPFPQNFNQKPKNVIDFKKNISLKSLPSKTKISNTLLMSTSSV